MPVSYQIENGFRSDVPALAPLRAAFLSQADYKDFFATVVVLDPSGKLLLGYTGRSYPANYKPNGCYRDGRFAANLQRSLERFKRAQAIEADAKLTAEEKAARLAELQKDVLSAVEKLKTLHVEMETP